MAFASSNGARIHYEVIDATSPWIESPETLILQHGIGADPDMWRTWLPTLIDRYRVVITDLRGYRRSVSSAPGPSWTLANLSDDVIAVADAMGLETFHLLGESIGGTIALDCAVRYPARVARLIVSNGGHVGSSIERVQAWQKQLDDLGVRAWSDEFMQQRFHADALDPVQRAWYASRQEGWSPEAIMNPLRVLVGTDLRPVLDRIVCPTLIMHPDGSPFMPVEIAVDLHRRLPTSRLQVFAHSRHGLPFSHADACARLVRQFLDDDLA